jgi:hypothetical protein
MIYRLPINEGASYEIFEGLWQMPQFYSKQLPKFFEEKELMAYNHLYRQVQRVGKDGSTKLISIPSPFLKAEQRMWLKKVEELPIHPNAHGVRKETNCYTALKPHQGYKCLLTLDIKSFFRSTTVDKVYNLLWANRGKLDLTKEQIRMITSLTCLGNRLAVGSRLSPALASSTFFYLDQQFSNLASSSGWVYTRYADDMIWSNHTFKYAVHQNITEYVGGILNENGYKLNMGKVKLNPCLVLGRSTLPETFNLPRKELV